jgi:hypothetical protein
MDRGKVFQCEITISQMVEEKLLRKHNIETWEIEEIIYDDPHAFSIHFRDLYFVYGRTYAGRYVLALVRILSENEVTSMGMEPGTRMIKIITARDMNKKQKKTYQDRVKG